MKSIATKNLTISKLIAVFGAILMLACIFLPYASAIGEHKVMLTENSDEVVYQALNITAGDMIHVSMFQYANLYNQLSDQIFGSTSAGVLYIVLVALMGGFALIAALFALGKKPIAVLIFSLLSYGIFSIHNWDFTDRGVVPNANYGWGVGYYLFFGAAIATFIGAVWMVVAKIKIKKAARTVVLE